MNKTEFESRYRPDVDGLRAIAVLGVVIFHAESAVLTGGFIGVDIFFVISGFVITRMILKQTKQNTFSILNFYDRRIRRILPAYFLVCVCSLLLSAILFFPQDLKSAGQSVVAANLYLSNLLFWHQTGYFDASAELKPLLHTWSLSVEEQFYLFFPILLIVASRVNRTLLIVSVVMGVSFFLNAYYTNVSQPLAFYLTPFRIWQFCVGAAVAILEARFTDKRASYILGAAGVTAILYSVFVYSDKTLYPGWPALVPTLGAACIIMSGSLYHHNVLSSLLSNKLFVYLGKISYSLYLWHWPIFVFSFYCFYHNTLVLIALSFLVSVISYHFIENPIRTGQLLSSGRALYSALVVAFVTTTAGGLYVHFNGGFPNSLDSRESELLGYTTALHDRQHCHHASLRSRNDICETIPEKGELDVLLVGDSHADAVSPALRFVGKDLGLNVAQFTDSGFRPFYGMTDLSYQERDPKLKQRLMDYIDSREPKLIVMLAYWSDVKNKTYIDANGIKLNAGDGIVSLGVESFLSRHRNIDILILSDYPSAEVFNPLLQAKAHRFNKSLASSISVKEYNELNNTYNSSFIKLADMNPNIYYLDLSKNFCDAENCTGVNDGNLLYFNGDHINTYGADLIVDSIYEKLSQVDIKTL